MRILLTNAVLGLFISLVLPCHSVAAQLPMSPTGDLLVSSSSNDKILRLAFDGEQLGEFTYPGLGHPRGIVVGESGVVVLISQNTDEVLILDRELKFLGRFPTTLVRGPTGAAIGPNGRLFVAGFASNNVGEFTIAGKLVRTYSAPQLSASNCVAFRPDGHFYVASAGTGSVVQFDTTGAFVRSFTGFGLSSPMGMGIWANQLYVAGGGSSNVVVFDFNGTAVREIRHADLAGPQGIAFTADGEFAVSNFYNHKVSWFRADGTHVRSVTPPSSQVPRSVAFLRGVTLDTTGQPVLGQPFPMTVRSPFEPGLDYVTALSFSTLPGVKVPDGRMFPLRYDAAFQFSLTLPGFIGVLDASGEAGVSLLLPNVPWLRGIQIHAAALTLDPNHAMLVRQMTGASSWVL